MSQEEIRLGRRILGPNHAPMIVAEMSGNHNQSLDRALAIVRAAGKAGAHAVKLQTYTADSMTLDIKEGPFVVQDPKSIWFGRSLYDLYTEASTPYDWHAPIFKLCHDLGMDCFSTPFDDSAVDFLESLGVPAYKIASFELTDLPLIRRVSRTGKPLIISTGMASLGEIADSVSTARAAGARDIVLLKCTSSYPASPIDSNVRTIPHLAQAFDVQVGLSDHTLGIGAAIASIAMGATFIEKHFTLSRADGGVDSMFSLEPSELAALVTESERAWQALGCVNYEPAKKEVGSKAFRRSLIVAEDIKEGDLFSSRNLRRLRPGYGLACAFYDEVIGKKATSHIQRGTPLKNGMWQP